MSKGMLGWPAAAMRTAGIEIMSHTRKILIVDDDSELRDALTEQLSLHEEFEPVAVENGSGAIQAAKVGPSRRAPAAVVDKFLQTLRSCAPCLKSGNRR
jgi:DNA-binding NtrC family response regulator